MRAKKQTATDFEPAPDRIKTSFGTLEFEGGSFPTEASVQKIYDEMDLQRATQAYMDFFPALSLYGIVKSQIRDFGFKSGSDVALVDFSGTWIVLKQKDGTIATLFENWVLGRAAEDKKPRWSVLRNGLHWGDPRSEDEVRDEGPESD